MVSKVTEKKDQHIKIYINKKEDKFDDCRTKVY